MRADTLLSVASLLQPLTPPLHGRAAVMLAPSEFSRPFSVDRKQKYQKAELVASPEECAALCKRFDLEGLDSLVANVSITRVKMGEDTLRVRASGSLTGLGVSRKNFGGERVTLDVQAIEFEAYYATESEDDLGGELDLSDDEAFDEPIIDGEINLEAGEWTDPDSEQGSVFYDSDPDEPDIPSNSGGTLGERLGF